jgi:hypothetical protein
MSGRTNACCARHCQLPQLHRRTAFLKTSSACIVGSRRCRSLGRCCRATRESSRSTSASPTRWCAFGANGCLAVIVEAWSRGPASTNCWPGTHCHRSRFSMATRREGISLVKNRMWEICTSQAQEVEVGSIRFRMGRTLSPLWAEPIPAAVGISTPIRSVWSTGED